MIAVIYCDLDTVFISGSETCLFPDFLLSYTSFENSQNTMFSLGCMPDDCNSNDEFIEV
ncbi:unnamed protein product [Periconia digitata]|uniref:Uncharacterized protein n=1 Tax=Periconia digitata TaxID=1303443 RepID=A0A9W4U9Y7_9PLEO|nr:unnamed protein product [Periconia digitata]